MNDRKNYNSIVFLTTLSVYLGLVLAGGAVPSVLAQAATTRGFDIKNEIVLEDDLDKKPDDETCSELGSFAEKRLKEFGFNQYIAIDFANLIKGSITDFVISNNEIDSSNSKSNLLDFLLPKSSGNVSKNSLSFKIDSLKSESKFSFTYSLDSATDAYLLASAFDYEFKYENCKSNHEFEKLIYTGSDISYKNNQVFIVTRLPRGSIDALLARKDAQ